MTELTRHAVEIQNEVGLNIFPGNANLYPTQIYNIRSDPHNVSATNPNGNYFDKPANDTKDDNFTINVYQDCRIVLNISPDLGQFDLTGVGPLAFDSTDMTNPLGRYFEVNYSANQLIIVGKFYANFNQNLTPNFDAFNVRLVNADGVTRVRFDPQIKNPGDGPGRGGGGT